MIRGFCLRVSALVLAFSSTPALVLRRQGPVNIGQRAGAWVTILRVRQQISNAKPNEVQQPRRTRSERERGADCHGGRSLQKQQQRCTIWLHCCAPMLAPSGPRAAAHRESDGGRHE